MSRAEYIGTFDAKSELGMGVDEEWSLIVERDPGTDSPRFVTCNVDDDPDTLYVKRRGECNVDVDFFDNCPYVADYPLVAELANA